MPQALTRKGLATRQRIIEGAAAEFRDQGVSTTLEDVMARTATSKSQLFHYFPEGKEQLLLAAARYEAARVLSDQQPYLAHLTSWRAWEAWRDAVVDRYRKQGQECPLSTLVTQLGRNTPGAQAIITELLGQWEAEIIAGIREMQVRRKVAADIDVCLAAAALLAGIQGGVLVMLATGQLRHLEAALDMGIQNLRDSLRP